jgi:hypothetical protein
MNTASLGEIVFRHSAEFKAHFMNMDLGTRHSLARGVAHGLILQYKELGLIRKGKRSSVFMRITDKGEQIRQFYVLKLGGRGTIVDRMDRFKVKPA